MNGRGHCEADWLGQCLADSDNQENDGEDAGAVIGGQLVIVDCRSASDYGTVHITGALSLALPTLIQRRLLKGNLAMPVALGYCGANDHGVKVTDDQWKSNLIVLYDESSTSSQLPRPVASEDVAKCSSSKLIAILLEHLRKEGYEACLLQGGLKHFKAKYPHLCTNMDEDDDSSLQTGFRNLNLSAAAVQQSEESAPPANDTTVPVEVLPHLFLGDAKNASDLECLEGRGIRYILNVTPNVPNKFETSDRFKYLQIPIKDHWSQNLTNYFPQAITFIDEGRRQEQGVLVHCLAGISRSVTVTVAYIMYSMSLSLNDAYDYVKRRKPNVSPNLTFMGQLLDFEKTLKNDRRLGSCSCHSTNSSSGFCSSSFSPSSCSLSCPSCASSSTSCVGSPPDKGGSYEPEVNCSCAVTPNNDTGAATANTTNSVVKVPISSSVTTMTSSSYSHDVNHDTKHALIYANKRSTTPD